MNSAIFTPAYGTQKCRRFISENDFGDDLETAKAVPNTKPNTKFTKGIFGLQNDFGEDFGDRQSVDPPMSDEYVAHFGSVDAELSGPRMFGPPMSDEYVAPLGQSKPGPGY